MYQNKYKMVDDPKKIIDKSYRVWAILYRVIHLT